MDVELIHPEVGVMDSLAILMDGSAEPLAPDAASRWAFLAAAGDPGFDWEAADGSSHLVITALIVAEAEMAELEAGLERIGSIFYEDGRPWPLPDSGEVTHRLKLLQELRPFKFGIYGFVADKPRIYQESGFVDRQGFAKFLNSRIDHELFRAFPNLQLVAGDSGTGVGEFIRGFREYVDRQHSPNLFGQYAFGFADRRAGHLGWLAQWIGDTLAAGFDHRRRSEHFPEFWALLKDKMIGLSEWPEAYRNYLVHAAIADRGDFDATVAGLAVRIAMEFVERHAASQEPLVQTQVRFLKFLLFKLRFDRPDQYVSTREILRNLNRAAGRAKDNIQQLRSEVIAKLRDEGVIIASSSQGYKLPISERELYDFADQMNSHAMPMLHRLEKCRSRVRQATAGRLDILDRPEYADLKRFFDGPEAAETQR